MLHSKKRMARINVSDILTLSSTGITVFVGSLFGAELPKEGPYANIVPGGILLHIERSKQKFVSVMEGWRGVLYEGAPDVVVSTRDPLRIDELKELLAEKNLVLTFDSSVLGAD